MRTFYINPATNDLELDGSNNFKMVEGDEEILQSVRLTIQTNINEWFLNPDFGFDRYMIQGKKIDEDLATDAIYEAILQDDRIEIVDDLTFNFDHSTRKLKIEFKFTKVDGDTLEGEMDV